MVNEIWKDIPELQGYYQASNLGRIKRLARTYKAFQKGSFYTGSMPEVIMSPKTSRIVTIRLPLKIGLRQEGKEVSKNKAE